MKETFGEYIKQLRTENELTLTQLAAKLDLDSFQRHHCKKNLRKQLRQRNADFSRAKSGIFKI